jgi:hypothetical protein
VSESRTATVSSGADLPYGVTFTISHALTRTTRLQRVGEGFIETETKQREWPVGNVRWSRTFRAGPLTLVAVGTSFRHREGSSIQANRSGAPALTSITSSSITPEYSSAGTASRSLGLADLSPCLSTATRPG